MATRRISAVILAGVMALGMSPAMAQQANGVIGGRAVDEAKRPFTDYTVRLRDAATGQIASTVPLDTQGQFTFEGVGLTQRMLVELFHNRQNEVVCTEGPYVLTPGLPSKTDVNIDCGLSPTSAWLIAAAAGTAAAVGLANGTPRPTTGGTPTVSQFSTQSASQ